MLMISDPIRQWDRLFDLGQSPSAQMDAYRLGDVITLQFDLPGVDASTLDVQIERGELRLTARRQTALPEGAKYLIHERADQMISRRVMLGDVLDVEHVDAEYVDGVLTVRIPLHAHAKPQRVEVRRGGTATLEPATITVESA